MNIFLFALYAELAITLAIIVGTSAYYVYQCFKSIK